MRMIITGGTGLIGEKLAARLASQGHEVFVLSRNPGAHQGLLPRGVQMAQWDGHSAKGWGNLVNGESAIINLAGENLSSGLWTPARKERILKSRTLAGKAVSEAVEKAHQKPQVVIQASAVGYYGSRADADIHEDHTPGSDFLSQVCIEWEAATLDVEKHGVRRAIIRTGVVLDRHSGALPKMALPFHFFVGGPLGSGKQWFPWIHIDDETSAIQFLLETSMAHGAFNLNAPYPLTNRGFSHELGKALHRPAVLPVPSFALRLLLGEMSSVVLDGQKTLPARLQKHGFTFRYPEADAALADLFKK